MVPNYDILSEYHRQQKPEEEEEWEQETSRKEKLLHAMCHQQTVEVAGQSWTIWQHRETNHGSTGTKKKASKCSTRVITCKVESDSVIIIIAVLRRYNGSSYFAIIWPERAQKLGKTQHVGPELLPTANLVALICNQQMSVLPCFPSVGIFYEDDYSPSKLSGTLLFIFERLQ